MAEAKCRRPPSDIRSKRLDKTFNTSREELILENGSGLFGDASATEPTLIAPMVNTDNEQFYIFTNNTNVSSPSSVYYSEIDLTLGANGAVTTKNVELLRGNPGEALDLLPHPNGTDFWVLTFDGAEQTKAFLVTASGVSTDPVISATGLTGQVKRGCINHTYDYETVVFGQNYGGANGTISVATVDRTTGEIGEAKVIATGDLGYHASFSEDGTKVYYVIGTEGWSGVAHQYDLETNIQTPLGGSGLGGSKLAPNGKLYFAGYGDGYLGVVNNPNEPGVAANFVVEGLYLEGCSAGFSVPNQTAAYLDYLPPVI